MNMTNISLLGVMPLLLLFCVALFFLWIIDRRLLLIILRTFGLAVVQLCVLGGYVWVLMRIDRWWAYGLWLIALPTIMAAVTVRQWRLEWRMLVPMTGGVLVAVALATALLMVCIPVSLLLPVAAVMAAALFETLGAAVCAYIRCFYNTQAHRYYLLANGASQIESLLPSVRRAMRSCVAPQLRRLSMPLVLTGTMLFWGMLLGGMAVEMAVAMTLLIWVAIFVAMVVAMLTTVFMLEKMNICS